MKKVILLIAALAILPVMVFAQFSAGPALFFKSPYLLGDTIDTDMSNVNQFSAGGDLRFRASFFQTEGILLYSLGEINSLNLFLDAGVALDFVLLTFTFGAGPSFATNFANSPLYQLGLNAKAGIDVRLGPVSVGLLYLMAMNVDTRSGLLGAHVLFWF